MGGHFTPTQAKPVTLVRGIATCEVPTTSSARPVQAASLMSGSHMEWKSSWHCTCYTGTLCIIQETLLKRVELYSSYTVLWVIKLQ